MLDAPLNIDDIALGEISWAATKALMSATAILLVAGVFGLVGGWQAVLSLPVVLLAGFCFGAWALVITSVARNYDFFLYYFTLVMTPMLLLSGVFFPLEQLPPVVANGAFLLPLAHAVAAVRPLMLGEFPVLLPLHVGVLVVYGAGAYWLATVILRRRLMS